MEAVGRLAGGIAHDFNNLLTAILGFTGLALDKLNSGTAGSVRARTGEAGRPNAPPVSPATPGLQPPAGLLPRPIDPAETIDAMMPMLRQLWAKTSTFPSAITPRRQSSVDPGQFEQVVMNLVVNARDAMPNGGKLRLGTVGHGNSSRRSRSGCSSNLVTMSVISVTDNGLGMDEITRATRSSSRFSPRSRPAKAPASAVHRLRNSEAERRRHRCHTAPSKGTTFHVYLPVDRANDAGGGNADSTPASRRRHERHCPGRRG